MSLLYFRINETSKNIFVPKEILNTDFNFSDKYSFSLINNELEISKVDNKDFFNVESSNIYNISAIVGENGSGKSTLLSLIINIIYDSNKYNKCSYTIAFELRNHICFFRNNMYFKPRSKVIVKDIINEKLIQESLLNNGIAFIYYSNCFTWNDYFCKSKKNYNYYNVSLNTKLEPYMLNIKDDRLLYDSSFIDQRYIIDNINNRKEKSFKDYISLFSKMDLYRIENINIRIKYQCYEKKISRFYCKDKCDIEMQLYSFFKKILKNKNKNFIRKVIIYSSVLDMFFAELFGKISNNDKISRQKIVNYFFQYFKFEKNDKTIANINRVMIELFGYLGRIDKSMILDSQELFLNGAINKRIPQDYWDKYIRDIENDFKKISEKYITLVNKINNLVLISNYEIKSNDEEVDFYNYVLDLQIEKKYFSELNILTEYIDENFSYDPFIYDFKGQSAGFYARIELESSLNNIITKMSRRKKYKANNVILILDEPDLYYHPKWSKNLVNDLIKFLSEFSNISFQIVMASNKPFILSDLPRENVITIGKEIIDNSTFASNIMNLLELDFFMDNYIGEFAVIKIKKIINNIKINKKGVEKEIDKIGDVIIRKSLYRLLEERRLKK